MHKRYKAKHFNGKIKFNNIGKMNTTVILLIMLALNCISGILSYFTSYATITNEFTIAPMYTVHFDANTGTGSMNDQRMIMGVSANLNQNSFTKAGNTFNGWNTAANGSGDSYDDEELVSNLTNVAGSTVTLYAQWQPNGYNITYTLNGGTVSTSNPATYTEETATFTLNNPTKTGYTFIGWSGTDLTGNTNLTVTIPQGSTGDRAYTANYTPITYYIRFNANGGTGSMSNQEMTYDTTAHLTQNDYTKPAYVFTEWTTSADGTGQHFSDGVSVANLATTNGAIVDLYAQWEDETNVAEVVGDKKYSSLSAAIAAVPADGVQRTIKLLRNITLPGTLTVAENQNIVFDFQHFTLSNTGNRNVIKNNGTMEFTNGTITSTAAYGAIDNNATGTLIVSGGRIITTGERQTIYNNGGDVIITGDTYLSSSASDRATIQNNKPDNGTAGTITISGGQIISTATTTRGVIENAATGTVIITGGTVTSNNAQGVDNKGTLIIGEEGGGVDITSPVIQGATYGVKTTSSAPVEFYDGIVKGKTNAFNNENYVTEIEDEYEIAHSTEDIDNETYQTAYLHSAKVQVRFDANGGTTSETVRLVDVNAPVGSLPTATRPRHSLDGWFTDPTNGTQIDATEVITAATTFYAHWTQTEAEVKFNANGGTPAETTEIVNVGSRVQSLPTVTKQYKTFAGWFTDPTNGTQIDGTETITHDTTYYAHWNSIPVDVTFNANGGYIGNVSDTEITRHISAGDVLESLPVPTRTDYGFAGWFTDPNGGTIIDGTEVITQNETYYAHWIDSSVAQIGDVKYPTLQAAVNAVPTNNTETTITVLSDIIEAIDIAANKNIVLNLQNYTLFNDGTKVVGEEQVAIRNKGTLRISNGTITADTKSSTINNDPGGRLIITGGNIIQTGTGDKKNKQAIYNNGGTVEISGTAYITAKNSGAYNGNNRGVIQNLNTGNRVGTLIITGGTIESLTGPGIVNQSTDNNNYSNTVTIGTKDGTIDSITPSIQAYTYGIQNKSGGILNIYDGIIKGKTGSIDGTVSDTETGATRVDTTETIGGQTYHVTYYQ